MNERTFEDEVSYTLAGARRLNLFGVILPDMFANIENQLKYLVEKNDEAIEIVMNTPGGSVIDGLAIFDSITRYNKRVPINILATGACMSMGTVILQAARVRQATENAQFLLHEVKYGNNGSMTDHEDEIENTKKLQLRLNTMIALRTTLSVEQLQALIKRKDHVISAREALAIQLIDEII